MPQTGYTPIQLYRSTTATTVPDAANLSPGELAINIADNDMTLYTENASGTVQKLMNNPAGLTYPTADGTSGQVVTTNGSGTLSFGDAIPGLTATAAELNILDGATVTTAELNVLDGMTATTAELNVLDGIPPTLTATELGYVDGVTSAIQTQIDNKYTATTQTQAAWEAGTSTTESLVSPAKVAAAIDALAVKPGDSVTLGAVTATSFTGDGSGLTNLPSTYQKVISPTVPSTSGAAIDFTGIPSWATRVTVMFDGVSLSANDGIIIQIGDSGGLETFGYTGSASFIGGASAGSVITPGTGYLLTFNNAAGYAYGGSVILNYAGNNLWLANGSLGLTAPGGGTTVFGGSKTLTGTLTSIRVRPAGISSFDAGSITISYEG